MGTLHDWQIREVEEEYIEAISRYPAFNSAHEGYAVILEELDELKAEVFKNPSRRSDMRMRREATQVAAMAMRFIFDVCLEDN